MPQFTDYDVANINRVIRKVDGISGPGVSNLPESITINPPSIRQPNPPIAAPMIAPCCLQNPVSRYGYSEGGIIGTNAYPCDYMYDIYTIANWGESEDANGVQFLAPVPGTLIAKGVPMLGYGRREVGINMNPGIVGLYIMVGGRAMLIDADESAIGVVACNTGATTEYFTPPFQLASSGES